MTPQPLPNRLALLDSHAIIYRAFYAYPLLTTTQGVPINAVYGYLRILLTFLRDMSPEYVAAAFDLPAPTFRHTDFAGYKAQRKEMPQELQPQIEIVKECVQALGIPIFAVEGYEADDVIGTLARQSVEHDNTSVLIVTGDQDSFQLVTEEVHVLLPALGKRGEQEVGPEEVKEKLGISPQQVVDYKALAGDASDNIPGVKGIGKKTAAALIVKYGSLAELYTHVTHPEPKEFTPGLLQKLAEGYESAQLSYKLATIDQHVPITATLQSCRVVCYDKAAAIATLQKYEFSSLIPLLPPDEFEQDVESALL
jgi:DNA polymerase-1